MKIIAIGINPTKGLEVVCGTCAGALCATAKVNMLVTLTFQNLFALTLYKFNIKLDNMQPRRFIELPTNKGDVN